MGSADGQRSPGAQDRWHVARTEKSPYCSVPRDSVCTTTPRATSFPGAGDCSSAAGRAVPANAHYLVRSDDDGDFLDQLRHAARVKHHSPGL
jgi:hypothetical protein